MVMFLICFIFSPGDQTGLNMNLVRVMTVIQFSV